MRSQKEPREGLAADAGGHLDTQQTQNNQRAAFFQAKNGGTLTTFAFSPCLEMLPAALFVLLVGGLS